MVPQSLSGHLFSVAQSRRGREEVGRPTPAEGGPCLRPCSRLAPGALLACPPSLTACRGLLVNDRSPPVPVPGPGVFPVWEVEAQCGQVAAQGHMPAAGTWSQLLCLRPNVPAVALRGPAWDPRSVHSLRAQLGAVLSSAALGVFPSASAHPAKSVNSIQFDKSLEVK